MWTMNFQVFKLDLEKAEEPAIKFNICWIIKKAREFQKNIYFYFIDYIKWCRFWWCWWCGSQQTGKFFTKWEYQTSSPASWEICMLVKKQQLEPDIEQSCSKSGMEYAKSVYCHHSYLTYIKSTSWKMLGWQSTSWNKDCWEKYH